MSTLFRAALSVTMSKTVIPWKCSVEGQSELESDERIGQALGGPAIGVVAKATRQRYTVGCKRKIAREADACKTPDAVGALLRRGGLYFSPLTTRRAAGSEGSWP